MKFHQVSLFLEVFKRIKKIHEQNQLVIVFYIKEKTRINIRVFFI